MPTTRKPRVGRKPASATPLSDPAHGTAEDHDAVIATSHGVLRLPASATASDWTADDDDPIKATPDDEEPTVEADRVADDVHRNRIRPGHRIMEPAAIGAALHAAGYDGSFDHLSSGEEQRVRTLLQIRDADLFRPHLIGTPAMLKRLDDLGRAQGNFAAVTALVQRAVHLSLVSGSPISVPPVLLLGSPGIGKSRYARALGDGLGTDLHTVTGSTIPDVGSLTGYPPAWRGAGAGRIARFAMASATTAPVVFVDEAEKISDYEAMRSPLDRILTAIEPSTACAYRDENLQVPMRLHRAIWLFACNSLENLSAPFLDRVVTFRIPDLSPDQRDAVLEGMLTEIAAPLGLMLSFGSPAAMAPLHELGLRRSRLAIEIAVGMAVTAQRRFLTRGDIAAAVGLLGGGETRAPIGFVRLRE